MPPRKKKPTAGGGGGGALSSLGGAFRGRGKKSKTKEVVRAVGGLVNTLGWLWKDRKPVPKMPPKPNDDDEEDDDEIDQVVRSLPSFIKLNLITPGSGSEFKKSQQYKNYAEFDISANLRILEFRNRLMDFFGEWQELKPSDDVAGATKATKAKKAKEKAKNKGKEPKVIKHKPPIAQNLITGRHIWVDSTKIGDIVTFVGGGGGDGTGDGETMHSFLPWAGHGTELMRYGPVVIVLGSAELDVPPLDASEKLPHPTSTLRLASARRKDGHPANVMSRPSTSASAKPCQDEEEEDEEADGRRKRNGGAPPVRTTQTWVGSNLQSHLVPQKSVHLISYPVSNNGSFQPTIPSKTTSNKYSNTHSFKKKSNKVSPDFEELTTSVKPREPLGLSEGRVDLKGIDLHEAPLIKAQ